MNPATPLRAAEASPPQDRDAQDRDAQDRTAGDVSSPVGDASVEDAWLGDASLNRTPPELGSYRRFDGRHDTNRAAPGKPSASPRESHEAAATSPTPSPDGDDPAFTLRSLLRLHAADLIVTLRQWGERLDNREATLDLRAAHLNLLWRHGRASPRPNEEASDDPRAPAAQTRPTPANGPTAETKTSDAPIDSAISRGWGDELAAQRQAIDRLRHDADRFANRLESSLP